MEEFQGIDIVRDWHYRTVECQCVIDDMLQGIKFHIIAEESISYVVCNLLKRQMLYVIKKTLWQFVYLLRHIQALVFCQSLDYCLFERCHRGFFICTIVFHRF